MKEATTKDAFVFYCKSKGIKYKTMYVLDKHMEENGHLKSVEFYYIIEKFLELAGDSIIQGNSLYIPKVGYIYVRMCNHNPKSPFKKIDWGESNKYRNKLIAEGKVPYKKGVRDHGEKWLHYYYSDYFRWDFLPDREMYVEKYLFKATENTKNKKTKKITFGTRKKLQKANKENPYLKLKYVRK